VDVLLVAVRRALGPENVLNVRNRGWRYVEPSAVAAATTASAS
jgi:hypothetical protein